MKSIVFIFTTIRILYSEKLTKENTSNDTNCRNRTIDEFPKDFFTEEQNKNGGWFIFKLEKLLLQNTLFFFYAGIVAHILITFYLFGALAIVCDDYFVKSLELLSHGN